MSKIQIYICLSLGLYFGWLLSVPFNGPIMYAYLINNEFNVSIPMVFILFHALGLLTLGIWVKRVEQWRKMLVSGCAVSLILSFFVSFMPFYLWPFVFSIIGVSSSMFILGWSYPYAVFIDHKNRMKFMAITIIIANMILVFSNFLLINLNYKFVYFIILLFLGGTLYFSFIITKKDLNDINTNSEKNLIKLSKSFIMIFCLLIFALFINGGFMYQVMYPSLSKYESIYIFYRYIPYIVVLLIMWHYGDRLQRQLPVYLGVSFMGLAFLAFSILSDNLAGYFLIDTLIHASFAFLDLFFFTILGDISGISKNIFRFFGFGFTAMVGAIFIGGLFGEWIMAGVEGYQIFIAIFAVAVIFMVLSIIPWIFNKIEEFSKIYSEGDKSKTNMELFAKVFDDVKLTQRETEIMELLLNGNSNKTIAAMLYMSENTLKTHNRNIYKKLNIKNRQELIYKVFGIKPTS